MACTRRFFCQRASASVDAAHFVWIVGDDHRAVAALERGDIDDVDEVVFALRIVVADLAEQIEQVRRLHRHEARVAQTAGALFLVGVLVFDHHRDPAVIVSKDATVLQRVFRFEAEHDHGRRVGRVQPLDHRAHRLGAHERHIAVEDQYVAVEAGQRLFRLLHRMAGA